MKPMGAFNHEAAKRSRARRENPLERALRPSMRQAVLEAYRLATDMDTLGAGLDFIQRLCALAAVDLYVVGEEKPIRVYGFTDDPD